MGNGMSFKAGRDMPPGMQEKMAMKMVAELQQKNGIPSDEEKGRVQIRSIAGEWKKDESQSATAVTAENRKLFDDLRNGREGQKLTAASAIAELNEVNKEYTKRMMSAVAPYIRNLIYKHIMEKTAERGERPQAVLVGPELMMLLLDEPREICRRSDGTYIWRNLPIIEARTRAEVFIVWDTEAFRLPEPQEVERDA